MHADADRIVHSPGYINIAVVFINSRCVAFHKRNFSTNELHLVTATTHWPLKVW